MEDVLRELRGEPCPSCGGMHCTGGPGELALFAAWLREGCAHVPGEITYLKSHIEHSTWVIDGYASIDAVRDHITRLQRLLDWSQGRIIEEPKGT